MDIIHAVAVPTDYPVTDLISAYSFSLHPVSPLFVLWSSCLFPYYTHDFLPDKILHAVGFSLDP